MELLVSALWTACFDSCRGVFFLASDAYLSERLKNLKEDYITLKTSQSARQLN